MSAARRGATGAESRPDPEGRPLDVSFVTVVYKTPEFLRRCLDSLEESRLAVSWEAIVIDNAPEEGGCDSVAQGRAGVRYIPNSRNVGFGRACNQGMRLARGRYYFLLNPDMEVRPGSVEELVAFLEREPDAGMVAPRLEYADGSLQLSCRTFYTLPIFILRRTVIGRLFPDSALIRRHLLSDWDHSETREVDWCLGAALLVRREAVREVGMMDERFFMYFEDVDWCYRMHQRAWRVVYHPASRMVHHYQRASAGWRPSRGLLWHLSSTLRYYEKWSFVLYWLKLRGGALRTAALFFSDLVMVVVAFLLAYAARSMAGGLLTKPLYALDLYLRFVAFTVGVAMASFFSSGLYRHRTRPSWVETALPVARALLWTSILMMAATFLFSVRIFSRAVVVLFFPLAVLLVTSGRVALLRAVDSIRRRDLNLRRVGLLGPPGSIAMLLERFERHGRFGMEPVDLSPMTPAGADPHALLHRLRAERVQELILFEEWSGDGPGLIALLGQAGVDLRVMPRLRDVLPPRSTLAEFMGWPSVRVGGESAAAGRHPGRRLLDVTAALLLGLLWSPVFLLGLVVTRPPRLERRRLHGTAGRLFQIRLLGRGTGGRGPLRELYRWYPGLPALARGDVSLVGTYPFTEEEWGSLSQAYRSNPPDAPAGLLGPWTSRRLGLEVLADWNRSYAERWSAAEDFRIFWRAVFSMQHPTGGES